VNEQTPAPEPRVQRRRDWGNTASDYAQFRHGFPESFYDRLTTIGLIRPGIRVLDLGTGTGTLARHLAQRGCEVSAVDVAPAMLAQAERLDHESGVMIDYLNCKAEQIGFSNASFDLVTAGTCWHWFDRPEAAREARRVLCREGRLLIASLDMITLPGNVVDALVELMARFHGLSEAQVEKGRHRGNFNWPFWLDDLIAAGFRNIECFSYEEELPYSHVAFRGRVRASWGVGPTLSADRVAEFDREMGSILERRFPTQPLIVPHRIFAVTAIARD